MSGKSVDEPTVTSDLGTAANSELLTPGSEIPGLTAVPTPISAPVSSPNGTPLEPVPSILLDKEVQPNPTPQPTGKPEESLPARGTKKAGKGKLLAAVVVVLLLLPALFVGLNFYAQSVINDVEIEVTQIHVTGSDKSHIDMELEMVIDNPASRSTIVKKMGLDVLYQGTSIGFLDVPPQELGSGKNELTISTRLSSYSGPGLGTFVTAFIENEEVEVDVEGDIELEGAFYSGKRLEQTVTIPGLAGFSIEVTALSLLELTDTGMMFQTEALVTNPGILSLELNETVFGLHYNQSELASLVFPAQTLLPGENTLTTSFTIPATQNGSYTELASLIVLGQSPQFLIQGKDTGANLLSSLSTRFSYLYSMELDSAVSTTLGNMSLGSRTKDMVSFNIQAMVENPTPVTLALSDLDFQAHYQGAVIGSIQFTDTETLAPGSKIHNLSLEITNYSPEAAMLFGDYLLGGAVELEVVASHGFSEGKALEFSLPVLLDGGGTGLSAELEALEVLDSNETAILTRLNLSLNNPLPFNGGELEDVYLQLLSGGELVGELRLDELPLTKGQSRLSTEATLVPVSPEAMQNLSLSIFNGAAQELVLRGSEESPDLLSRLLSKMELTVPLEPVSVSLKVNSLGILSEEEDRLGFTVDYSISNPTALRLTKLNFTGSLSYLGQTMGETFIEAVSMGPGVTNHSGYLEISSLQQDVATDFVDAYLGGEEISFLLEGALASQAGAGNFFTLELDMPTTGQPLEVEIESVHINEASEEALNLTVNITLENPTVLKGPLRDILFEVYYQGHLVTVLELPLLQLEVGSNSFSLELVVAPENDTGLRELVGAILDGHDARLLLRGKLSEDSLGVMSGFMDGLELSAWVRASGELGVTLRDLTLLQATEDALELGLLLELNNPSPISGLVTNLSFAIYYDEGFVGDAFFQEVSLGPGINLLNLSSWVQDQGNDVLPTLVEDLLAGKDVSLTVNGSSKDASLVSRVLGNTSFQLQLNGSGELEIELKGVTVNQVRDDGMNLSLDVLVNNPTPIHGLVTNLAFSVFYNGSLISDLVLGDVQLHKGENHLNLTTNFSDAQLAPLQEMMERFLDGESVTLVLKGSEAGSTSFVSKILSEVELELNLTTGGPLEIELRELTIEELGEEEATFSLLVEGTNPGSIGGILTRLALDVHYKGEKIAVASFDELEIQSGAFSQRVLATIRPDNASALGDMVGTLINGTNISLVLRGNSGESTSFLSRLMAGLEFQVNLTTTGPLTIDFQDLYINEVGEDSMNISLLLDLNNPTSIKGILTDLSFDLFQEDIYLGFASLQQVKLPLGRQLLNLTAQLHPQGSEPMSAMLQDLLSGTSVTILAKGAEGNGSAFLDHIMKALEFEIQLNSSGSLELELEDIQVEHIGEDFLDIQLNLSVTNPTDLQGVLADLSFDVYYNGSFLEQAVLEDLKLAKGSQSILYSSRVRPNDPDVLEEMAELLFSGSNITLVVKGSQGNSSAFLPAVVADLEFEAVVHSRGELTVEMDELSLLESHSDYLVLGVNLTLDNPTDIRVNLDTLYFDVMDGELDVGDVILSPFTLMPGENRPVATMILEGDEDTLSGIISKHINGEDQSFRIQAAENISDTLVGGIVSQLDQSVVLPGLEGDLISKVRVTSLSVTVVPAGLTVTVEVTLNNPSSFTIEVSELDYDVHYDDNDVSSVPFVASYPAKDNIYLNTVTETLSPRLVLEAGSSTNKESTIRSSSMEHCVRLNDEYMMDNDLVAHVYGTMIFHMGDFQLETEFEVTDIRVPRG